MSFIKFNKDYFKSVEGVLKAALIITGAFCWGLVYIGAVLSTSNEPPEVYDQALFCAAVTLPIWILTLVSYAVLSISESRTLAKIDVVFNAVAALLYAVCATFCAATHWFVWWCEYSYELVDVGVCPDEESFRNGGQNIAVLLMLFVLAIGYGFSGVCIVRKICCANRQDDISEDIDDKPELTKKMLEAGSS